MELAIPLVAMGGLYVASKQKRENFTNSQLPNVDLQDKTELNYKTELNHKKELKELKELSLKMNHILQDQNNELQNINQDVGNQEFMLKNNIRKINNLILN